MVFIYGEKSRKKEIKFPSLIPLEGKKKRDKISQLDPFRREQGLRVPFFLEGMEFFYGLYIWGEK
jgi:hypothetical protein